MKTTRRRVPAAPSLDLAERLPELHSALLQQQQFRLEQLHELAEATANSAPAVEDVHDHIGEILRTSATAALAEVDAALERMRTRSYGICERCAERITLERLEILPMSRYCMRCQRVNEIRLA
jgi:DnaK suppressor protein